eukprot:3021212-Rhodomonas_salina.1
MLVGGLGLILAGAVDSQTSRSPPSLSCSLFFARVFVCRCLLSLLLFLFLCLFLFFFVVALVAVLMVSCAFSGEKSVAAPGQFCSVAARAEAAAAHDEAASAQAKSRPQPPSRSTSRPQHHRQPQRPRAPLALTAC